MTSHLLESIRSGTVTIESDDRVLHLGLEQVPPPAYQLVDGALL